MRGQRVYDIQYKIQIIEIALWHESNGGSYSDVEAFADIAYGHIKIWLKHYQEKTWVKQSVKNAEWIPALSTEKQIELKNKLLKFQTAPGSRRQRSMTTPKCHTGEG